jgi:hypothetical protein
MQSNNPGETSSSTAAGAAAAAPPAHHAPDATPPPPDPNMEPIVSITQRLLGLRGSPPGTLASLAENEIKLLCERARPILLGQSMLLELEAPLKICGDVHGQFTDLLRLLEYGGFPPEANYLFLGDYVDRGKQSLETICLLLAYKIQYPENFFILRGNHEAAGINRIYGFYDECKRRYSIKLWKIFSDVFNCLPVSALVEEKILCMHGGLSPEIRSLQQIADLQRPCDVPDVGLMCDLLWSDPDASVNVSSKGEIVQVTMFLLSFFKLILTSLSFCLCFTNLRAGLKMIEACLLSLEPTWLHRFCRSMTWTCWYAPIRWWRMDTSSLRDADW